MYTLVISGGGAKGAFGGGLASRLIETNVRPYDMYLGTSTGSLLVPLLAAGEIERIKEVFTHTAQEDIFSVSPFLISKSKEGVWKVGMNHTAISRQFLRRRKTLGESESLLRQITETLSEEIYERVRESKTSVIVTVANLTDDTIEYKELSECSRLDFCQWMWASSNIVPFMSVLEKDGCHYADGGYGSYAPISEAIRRGAKMVDVIVLRTKDARKDNRTIGNVFNLWMSTIDYMHQRLAESDIAIGKADALRRHAKLRIFYLPEPLTENALIFDPEEMSQWWEKGYEFGGTATPHIIDWTYSK